MFGFLMSHGQSRPSARRKASDKRTRPALESLEARELLTLTVQFDYSLDSRGFFAQSSRKALLESTVNAIVARFGDTLGSIASRDYTFEGVSGNVTVTTAVPANTLKLYLMGKPLADNTAGLGGSNTLTSGGLYRGQASSSDYAPAVSTIRFDDDGTTNWYFGAGTSSGVDANGVATSLSNDNFDFVSTVRHEFLHCLGLSSNAVFEGLVSGSSFVGPKAEAANHNNAVPLSGPGEAHVGFALTSVLNPSTDTGVRRDLTGVEYGMLQDIGWTVVDPPGFYTKYELLTRGEEGEVDLNVIPSRGVYLLRLDALNGDAIDLTTSDGTTSALKGVDTYLKLFDDQGKLLAENDDATSSSTKSHIHFTPAHGGTFYVGASTYAQRGYTFTTASSATVPSTGFRLAAVIDGRPDPGKDNIATVTSSVALGVTMTATLNDSSDLDYVRFDAVAGRTYTATTSLPAAGGYAGASILSIYDAKGHKVAGMAAIPANSHGGSYYGRASFTAAAGGPFYVAVSRYVGDASVALDAGSVGGGWGFVSSADSYSGGGDHDSANDYALKITDTTPPPPPPGGGGVVTPPPGGGGVVTPPLIQPQVLRVDSVAHAKGKKVTTITLAFNGPITPGSAADSTHFTLALGVRKKGHTRFTKGVAGAHTALGTSPNLVVITLAKPIKGPIQITVLPGVLGVNGASSSSIYMTVVV